MDQAQRPMQTESNEVLYDVSDHIAVITLNAPERMNTISGPMLNDLTRLLVSGKRGSRCSLRHPHRQRARILCRSGFTEGAQR